MRTGIDVRHNTDGEGPTRIRTGRGPTGATTDNRQVAGDTNGHGHQTTSRTDTDTHDLQTSDSLELRYSATIDSKGAGLCLDERGSLDDGVGKRKQPHTHYW
jgi:hypothetical protein